MHMLMHCNVKGLLMHGTPTQLLMRCTVIDHEHRTYSSTSVQYCTPLHLLLHCTPVYLLMLVNVALGCHQPGAGSTSEPPRQLA
jgi:hypothetical protein